MINKEHKITTSTSIEEAERIYEQVKERLSNARQTEVTKAKETDRHYGHDLFGAIRAADRQIQRDKAAEYLKDVCDDNLFAAFGLLVDAFLDSDKPLRSKETRPQQLRRALESEVEDIDRSVTYSEKRKAEWNV